MHIYTSKSACYLPFRYQNQIYVILWLLKRVFFHVMGVKISLITVSFNARDTIEECIRSVIGQTYKNVEYIVIDGGSSDGTIEIINKYRDHIQHFESGPDKGIYDAMNRGIKIATGDLVGLINADDCFADRRVLESVGGIFANDQIKILYADLNYMDKLGKIFRKWRSGLYRYGKFNWGWMPPHPTFYCRKNLYDEFVLSSLDFGTAADYELMLRFMHKHKVDAFYLQKVLVEMKVGGISNKNIR